ncbi:MAG TPA: dihydrodipicolinate synthase family protein, partial [Solirubrobacterales bacterium]|nr:dihydrodipicolinate synthase family protein [Solirubrobacterales bacterium]
MTAIRGVITAMATPFDEAGGVDEGAARRLAAHLVEHGSHGVVVAGTTGECPVLTDEEQISLLRAVRDELGDAALVVCGTGTNDTRHSRELTKAAAAAGADAALVVAPYYNKPNRAGLRAHFEAVAEAAPELPMILYNIPARVVINMPPGFLSELSSIDNV